MYDRPVSTEDTPRTLLVAVALWGALVAAAAHAGAFARLSAAELAALAAFGFVFATATYCLDRQVRNLVDAIDLRALAILALVADGAIAAGAGLAMMAVVVFAVPLAGAAQVALVDRLFHPHAWSVSKRARAGDIPSAAA